MEKVSVVVPCFNSGKTINRTISSINAQTWQNVEIIIVNDGSTDAYTLKTLKEIKNVKIVNQNNKGLPSARNTGIKKSSGNYILFLDADDWIEKNSIELMLETLKRYNSDYVFCNTYLEGERNGEQKRYYNFFEQLFLNNISYFMLIKKNVIENAGCYDEKMTLGYEDWELNIRLGKNGYFPEKVEEFLFHYNVSNSGMLNSVSKKKHATILEYIRTKHKSLYTFSNILKIYFEWRKQKNNHNIFIYVLLYIFNLILPISMFNKCFYLLHISKIRLYKNK